jgi:hypothetical protein
VPEARQPALWPGACGVTGDQFEGDRGLIVASRRRWRCHRRRGRWRR